MRGNKIPIVDLSFYNLDDSIDWLAFEYKPTACLFVVDGEIDYQKIYSVVAGALGAGCMFFLFWGAKADELHDQVDEILEGGDDAWLNVSTVSCEGEDAEDVSISLFLATYPGRMNVRYVVFTDGAVERLRNMIRIPTE